MRRSILLITLAACGLSCAAGLIVAGRQSATTDEVPHIGAGPAYLSGDLRLNREHPPLVKVLAASLLPERARALRLPPELPAVDLQWSFGRAVLYGGQTDPLEVLFRARLPIVLLSSLLLPIVAAWSYALGGLVAASSAVLLLALCPLWLAHSTLVTMDAAATLFAFGAAAAGFGLVRAPRSRMRAYAAALALAVALGLASKYSMVASTALVGFALALDAYRQRRRDALVLGWFAIAIGFFAGIVFAWGLPPRPELYFDGMSKVGANHDASHVYYAFGSFFIGSDPLYFVRALSVKVPLPVLFALFAGTCLLLLERTRFGSTGAQHPGSFSFLLVIPPLGHLALMSMFAPALGVRYVLPVLPFLYVGAGLGCAALWKRRRLRWLLAPIALGQVASFAIALQSSPLAFFNGWPCRTGEARPCLDDSNVDWGQALPDLKQLRDARYPGEPVRILYFGSSPPQAYVDNAQVAAPDEIYAPRPALYAVSLHLLLRAPGRSWLREREPVTIVGGAYAFYDLRSR